jgi:hypothetical protein
VGEKWGREWGPWVGNSNFDGWREKEEKRKDGTKHSDLDCRIVSKKISKLAFLGRNI